MTTPGSQSTLLIIDDDDLMLRFIGAACRGAHGDSVTIECCTDPAAALARLELGGVDVVLTDLEMPGVDGLAVLKAAKKRNALTQVVLITGHSSHESLLEALEAGAADYVLKPVDSRHVAELVGDALTRCRRWRRTLADTWKSRPPASSLSH